MSQGERHGKIPDGLNLCRTLPYFDKVLTYTAPANRSGEIAARCPFHEDRDPSLSLNIQSGKWCCFSCGRSGDAMAMAELLGADGYPEAVNAVEAAIKSPGEPRAATGAYTPPYANYHPKDPNAAPTPLPPPNVLKEWQDALTGSESLMNRLAKQKGLREESVVRFGLGWTGHRIAIPIRSQGGELVNVRQYDILGSGGPKMLNWVGSEVGLWAPDPKAWESGRIVLCEGEWDAMLMTQEGYPSVTSTGGANTWRPGWADAFAGKDVLVVYDRDKAGMEGSQRAAKALGGRAASVTRLVVPGPDPIPESHGRDLSDMILGGDDVEAFLGLRTPEANEEDGLEAIENLDLLSEEPPRERKVISIQDYLRPYSRASYTASDIATPQETEETPTDSDLEADLNALKDANLSPSGADRDILIQQYIRKLLKVKKAERRPDSWLTSRLTILAQSTKPPIPRTYLRQIVEEEKEREEALLHPVLRPYPKDPSEILPPVMRWSVPLQELKYAIYCGMDSKTPLFVPRSEAPFYVSNQNRSMTPIDEITAARIGAPSEYIVGWSDVLGSPYGIGDWVGNRPCPSPKEIFNAVRTFLENYIWFRQDWEYDVCALWVMHTYHYAMFPWTPYLWITGTMNTGKSLILDIFSLLAFYPTQTSNTSPAALYRITGRKGGTMLLDEAEDTHTQFGDSTLLEVLRSGNKVTGNAMRSGKKDSDIVPETFPSFSPKALANVSYLEPALRSRCIQIPTSLKPRWAKREPFNVINCAPTAQIVRNLLFFGGLTYATAVWRHYEHILAEVPELVNRSKDTWTPLLAEARLVDEDLFKALAKIALEREQATSEELAENDFDLHILESLLYMAYEGLTKDASDGYRAFPVPDLLDTYEQLIGTKPTPEESKNILHAIRRLGLSDQDSHHHAANADALNFKKKIDGRSIRCYRLDPTRVRRVAEDRGINLNIDHSEDKSGATWLFGRKI